MLNLADSHMRGETGLTGPHQAAWLASAIHLVTCLQAEENLREMEREEALARVCL